MVVGFDVASQARKHDALKLSQVGEAMVFESVISNLIDKIQDRGIAFDLIVPSNTGQNWHILISSKMIFMMGSGKAFEPLSIFRSDDHQIEVAFCEVVQVALRSRLEHTGLIFVKNGNAVLIKKRV
ncbi:MAG: hypothetical protein A2W53_04690 [Nitrospinae bacterium RIFCSPHIGHO2_02_39_11]|nr:MAG: hypothetical protein A2W53_04690 [Nitrospinae bacterium RIFCSPHIGHO2_02_39_11]